MALIISYITHINISGVRIVYIIFINNNNNIVMRCTYSLYSTYDIRNNVIVEQGEHDFTTIISIGID